MSGVSFEKAYHRDITPSTGGWRSSSSEVLQHIKSTLARYNASSGWVGIYSNGESGLRKRWNDKYKGLGMNHVAVFYETSSDSFRKEMETFLVNKISEYAPRSFSFESSNLIDGGGTYDDDDIHVVGPNGAPPMGVYVAWRV